MSTSMVSEKKSDPHGYAIDHELPSKRIYYQSLSNPESLLIIGAEGGMVDMQTNERASGWYVQLGKDGGNRFHFVDGKWHHDHEPACILKDGKGSIWYINGCMHRTDGPAVDIVTTWGDKRVGWFKDNQRHRVDGPAEVVIKANGARFEMYYQHDALHRTDGPALVVYSPDGSLHSEEYRQHGVLHRDGGPAYQCGAYMEFRQEGELHNIEGPALVVPGHEPLYFLQGLKVEAADQRKAYLENRNARIGKSKSSTGPVPARSTEQRRQEMESKIDRWVSKRSAQAKSPKP